MISFDEAVGLVHGVAVPLGTEMVSLEGASGRVLAVPVAARIESPRTNVSAMDGYAVRDSDLLNLPARLRVAGESFAGEAWDEELRAGDCVRIFTGAAVPLGADRVIMQENVTRDGDTALFRGEPGKARHVRRKGSDFEVGDTLLPAGRLLGPRAIIAAAASDLASVEVYRRPSVRILSTGDELAEPGTAAARPDAIPESVSFGIAALAVEWGADVLERSRLRDDLGEMQKAAAQAVTTSDLVIVTGGASVGEKDFAKTMFEPLGLEMIFSKVSIKPGKPVWLGRVGNALIMGLPGNPTSAFVTARLLLAPLIAGLSGRRTDEALRWQSARLSTPLRECGPRETFHRGRRIGKDVELFDFQDSSAQKVLAASDLLVRQRANAPAAHAGSEVEVLSI